MIHVIDEDDEALSFTDERIGQAIIKTQARLCIFDPVQAFFCFSKWDFYYGSNAPDRNKSNS